MMEYESLLRTINKRESRMFIMCWLSLIIGFTLKFCFRYYTRDLPDIAPVIVLFMCRLIYADAKQVRRIKGYLSTASEQNWTKYEQFEQSVTNQKEVFSYKIFSLVFPLLFSGICLMGYVGLGWAVEIAVGCSLVAMFFIFRDVKAIEYTGLNRLALRDYIKPVKRTDEPTKAVFLDREGTIIKDKMMMSKIKDIELFDDTVSTLQSFRDKGYLIILVTNQSAISRGYYSTGAMHRFNKEVIKRVGGVDAIYYCPHEGNLGCQCHKPNAGMFKRAAAELYVDLSKSIVVGDRMSDIMAGANAGIPTRYFVTTGNYGEGGYQAEPNFGKVKQITVNHLSEIKDI